MSSAPPSAAPPGGAPRELVVPLEAEGGWRRRGPDPRIVLSPRGVVLEHPRCRVPLRLALGALALGAVEGAGAGEEGRFPILKRLGPERVLPREEGIEGWLWTARGGSGLVVLCEDAAPNLALVLAQPLAEDVIASTFDAELVRALAARSPLGAPSLYGLLLRVTDTSLAERTLMRFGLIRPLTDREVPKTLRRSLPTDRAADPAVPLVPGTAPASSVAPPGA